MELLRAIRDADGTIDIASRIRESSVEEIRYSDEGGRTPLYEACKIGNLRLVQLLLDRGAPINAATERLYTALHIASLNGFADLVAVLVLRGACVDSVDHDGETPIFHAIRTLNPKCVEILLSAGASLTAHDNYGRAPLHIAASVGDPDVLYLLHRWGANAHPVDADGDTPLHYAVASNHDECVRALVSLGGGVEIANEEGATAVHIAASRNCADVLRILLESGMSPHVADRAGRAPLHYASHAGPRSVRELLRFGADPNVKSTAGTRPLHWAAAADQAESVRLLIEGGGDARAVDEGGYGATHHAARVGGITTLVILSGLNTLDVSQADAGGRTPLHLASFADSGVAAFESARFILENGANPNAKDSQGNSPVDLFFERGFTEAASVCVAYGATTPAVLPVTPHALRRAARCDARHVEDSIDSMVSAWRSSGECVEHIGILKAPASTGPVATYVRTEGALRCWTMVLAEARHTTVQAVREALQTPDTMHSAALCASKFAEYNEIATELYAQREEVERAYAEERRSAGEVMSRRSPHS